MRLSRESPGVYPAAPEVLMARAIVVARGPADKESRFTFSAIDRSRLYGDRKKVIVDEKGEGCVGGLLSLDGSVLLLPDSRAMLYVDEHSDVVDRATLVTLDADGKPLTKLESTLDTPQPLVGPVPVERLLDHNATAIYMLAAEGPDAVDSEFLDGLSRGEIWETVFNYGAGYERQPLFLLQGQDGLYAIVAEPAELAWIDRGAPPPSDIDPIGDDDLDFSMF